MIYHLFILFLGFVFLYYGAELLISGSGKLAESYGVRKFIIGLTVLAFGTSAPELVVSCISSYEGKGDIALGNIIGSNIANIGLILGLTAIIVPLDIDKKILRWEVPLMIFASVLLLALSKDGELNRADGFILLALMIVFLWTCIAQSQNHKETQIIRKPSKKNRMKLIGLSLAGMIMLAFGGKFVVVAIEFAASEFHISEFILSLTVVALGTSLPELVVSILAALRKSGDMSVGNVIGSNLFNLLLVMGIASIIRPIPVAPAYIHFSLPVMIGFAVITFPLMHRNYKLGRLEGCIILIGYVAYLLYESFG